MAVQRVDVGGARSLEILGIGFDEERTYRWLLSHPRASAVEVARALSWPPAQVRAILKTIAAKGLVTPTQERPCRYLPVSPDIGIEALILRRQNELLSARSLARELQTQAISAESSDEPKPFADLIMGRAALRRAFEQIGRCAQREVLSLTRPPMLVSRLELTTAKDHYEQMGAAARGIRIRSVVDKDYLELPFAVGRVRENLEMGEEVRVIPRLPFKMVFSDRRLAIIFLGVQHPEGASLLIRSPTLLDALYSLFEFIWERATPVSLANVATVNMPGLDERRISEEAKELLALLATGMNDKRIVSELGISRSTYGRRIHELMKMLNASSRFQLGWIAKDFILARANVEN